MKKSLVALAVLGGASFLIPAMPAMAQSSVTLYGVADVGIGESQWPGKNIGGQKSVGMQANDISNNGNSRIGLRGVEDLGGGLKVGFNFESGLSLKDGAFAGSGGGFWGRTAKVWIGGPWGALEMGRGLTPSFFASNNIDLTGSANYSIYDVYRFNGHNSLSPRDNSMFVYKTPNFAGLKAQIGYIFKADNITPNKSKWDVAVMYNNGPIKASAAANKTKSRRTNYTVGGQFNFLQNFAVEASYQSVNDMATNARRRGYTLGGQARFGVLTGTVQVSRDTKNQWSARNHKYTNFNAEVKYALSKRTFLYGSYFKFDGTNNYGLGMRHNF